ncbi:hypothetical protein BE04_09105 [Sorangium cellulosum]|uniref:Uncharacterized protein n=1 Tax=Sorangium cellulosum TaxID=56 RepID=A0A150PRX3_SORCE|nr:hypothetical protein BE04_09105 [Sorangium cellulosum]
MPLDFRTRAPEDGARAALPALVAGIVPELDQEHGGGAELAGVLLGSRRRGGSAELALDPLVAGAVSPCR